jgi:hypothetical protein
MTSAAEIASAREAAEDVWREALREVDDGWSLVGRDVLDLGSVVEPFGLALDPAYDLVLVTARWGRDGEGHLFAVPSEVADEVRADLSEELDDWDEDEPPSVEAAESDIGVALTGDGSDEAVLMASVACRELHEVGAAGHGADWMDEVVLGEDGPDESEQPAWDWRGPQPERWAPTVTRAGGELIVVFHTQTDVGGHRLIRYEDRYRPGALAARRRYDVLAEAEGGRVH